jgi:hypothetical protein
MRGHEGQWTVSGLDPLFAQQALDDTQPGVDAPPRLFNCAHADNQARQGFT